MRVTLSLTPVFTPTAVALGNFDGIHQGHRQVIQPILKPLEQTDNLLCKTVVTFHPHPQEFFSGQPRSLLTPLDEKVAQLKELGVEQLVLLPFDRELSSLSPEQFVEQILVEKLQARLVSVGLDFCFGKGRQGSAQDLKELASRYGVEIAIAPLKVLNETRVSSSRIRQALLEGNVQYANYLLGRPYSLVGQVVQGQQLGRTIGFPTANLQLPPEKFLPCAGVYAVQVQVCDRPDGLLTCETAQLPGVMNLGTRPTVNGTGLVAEVHALDWSGDWYGRILSVQLEHFIRSEQKFASLEQLTAQIRTDCETARTLLASA
ncbi:MAG: bifunctional riboflavin kinase/FAD synthetase [Oscillatoriales cyanobacterium C42_A2020_001]|nr:bifunctional riboflavin kinase/FAD synthetase [Leptolyngbyaceae cyanobacterium C42_A2020_001]